MQNDHAQPQNNTAFEDLPLGFALKTAENHAENLEIFLLERGKGGRKEEESGIVEIRARK